MAAILVLSERQSDGADLPADERSRVLQQPVSLRELRLELEQLLKRLGKPVPSTAASGD
jgi:hypothetical protein